MTSPYEDKAAIRELHSEYCFRMDDADFAGVAALFTPDGDWFASYEQAHGREEIEALLTRINPQKGVGPFRKHIIVNGLIGLDGDRAAARTSYLVFADTGTGPAPIVVGTYQDRLVRPDGEWLLSERRLVHEIAGELKLRL
jgi:uncharacterized protein (TIGR02246 family)